MWGHDHSRNKLAGSTSLDRDVMHEPRDGDVAQCQQSKQNRDTMAMSRGTRSANGELGKEVGEPNRM
jgi:hypothetical protein